MQVKALKNFPYAGKSRRKGEIFEAPDKDGRALCQAHLTCPAKTAGKNQIKTPPIYQTRRLTADDHATPQQTAKRRGRPRRAAP